MSYRFIPALAARLAIALSVAALSTGARAESRHSGKVLVKLKSGQVFSHGASGYIQTRLRELLGILPLTLEVESVVSGLVPGLHSVNLGQGARFYQALDALKNDAAVEYAEPDYQVSIDFGAPKPQPSPKPTGQPGTGFPNDTQFSKEWAFVPAGQSGGSSWGVDTMPLWKASITGSRKVTVAIVDTGVDSHHPDLAANINTVDWYDFDGNKPDATDDNGHGTHVAGIIGAIGNNGSGVAGVNWNVSILALKFLDKNGSGDTSNGIKAIEYAVKKGARVISCSWGGPDGSQALKDAIDAARKAGVLVIAAAGNDGKNTDTNPNYPSAFHLDNMIVVAATDINGKLASFSNFGVKTVDISAPGVNIFNTYKGSTYQSLSGTSMATPMVSGVVALLLSQDPTATYQSIKARILGCGVKNSATQGLTLSGKSLSANNSYHSIGCN